jgi:hypothetical protein
MSFWSQPSLVGRRIILSDQGDGWFAGYTDVSGMVDAVIQADGGGSPYYIVRLEPPLELQKHSAATPSGLILKRYASCLIRSRWQGKDISLREPVSVHVVLIPLGAEPPRSTADVLGMTPDVWATCVVEAGSSRRA